ncbi:hypothetical protein [Sessilibacter corallicola]|uniref:hypothetical protein n=1 Tax=Sessilibacter corallicola TaxID=2904075 RepID=UPI001E407D94|nr:hypothetical protein [Sessilibacter corallicola]MCE2029265.1 hypothetical protein [Sessilibacter corallicola]
MFEWEIEWTENLTNETSFGFSMHTSTVVTDNFSEDEAKEILLESEPNAKIRKITLLESHNE